MILQRDDALIGGIWVLAPATVDVENPATEKIVGSAALSDRAMTDAAVGAARKAARKWGTTTSADRADLLDALVIALRERRDGFVDVIVAEGGVCVVSAHAWHVDLAIDLIESAAHNARTYGFEKIVRNSTLIRKPVGVVACITPWNYPLYQLAAKVGPALAAGCTVVLKPAELAPLSSYLFAEAAIARGARVVCGGTARPQEIGHFVSPTILADLDTSDPASQSEIFGPVLVVHPYTTETEAIDIANGTVYGLAGAVWSASEDHALEIAHQLDTGQIDPNGATFNAEAPFGGWKQSGTGRELGPVGLEEYTELAAVQR